MPSGRTAKTPSTARVVTVNAVDGQTGTAPFSTAGVASTAVIDQAVAAQFHPRSILDALFANKKSAKADSKANMAPDPQDPTKIIPAEYITNTQVNRYITMFSFATWLLVIGVEVWLIVNTFQTYRARDQRVQNDSSALASMPDASLSMPATTTSPDDHGAFRMTVFHTTSSSVQDVFWATKSASAIAPRRFKVRRASDIAGQAMAEAYKRSRRSLLEPAGAFKQVEARCLYVPGSQLPDKGIIALLFVVLYQLWTIMIVLAILAFEQRVLRYNRANHEAFFTGLIEGWLGIDVLVRGVELQLQIASAFIFVAAICNILCGAAATYRGRETLLWMIFHKRDWGKHFNSAVNDTRDTLTILQDRRKEEEKRAAAEGKPIAEIAAKSLAGRDLGEPDLKPAPEVQAYLTRPELLQGKSTAAANAEYKPIPEAARNAIPGGLFDPSKRVIGQQEIMSRLLFDSMAAGGGLSEGGGNANNGGGGLDRLLMLGIANMMMGNQGGNLFGAGNANTQQQPYVANNIMPGGPGMYGHPPVHDGYVPPHSMPYVQSQPPAMYPRAPADDAFTRFYQREATKPAQRRQRG